MTAYDKYALFAWGNFLDESGLNRVDGWLEPEVLRGERHFANPDLTMYDESELLVDASGTYFAVDGEFVLGRDITAPGEDWRAYYLRLVSDGTLEDTMRLATRLEEESELDRDDEPERNPIPVGEIVAQWEDPHGQWDMALVRL